MFQLLSLYKQLGEKDIAAKQNVQHGKSNELTTKTE